MTHRDDPDLQDDPRRGRIWRLGEQLSGLLDPEGALRRGQDLVSGVTSATKDEVMRLVSSEVRSFLDKMDAVDLLQEVIAGLVVDVNVRVRFSRDDEGKLQAKASDTSTKFDWRGAKSSEPPAPEGSEAAQEPPSPSAPSPEGNPAAAGSRNPAGPPPRAEP